MSTIGNLFVFEGVPSDLMPGNGIIVFKQCDMAQPASFPGPVIEKGEGGIRYFSFKTAVSDGLWTGINSCGVSFAASEPYMDRAIDIIRPVNTDISNAYRSILAKHKSARSAADYMYTFYKSFLQPDMIMISDYRESYFIEANNGNIRMIKKTRSHFVATNHFRMLDGAVQYKANRSTYLRLERAQEILQCDQSLKGVFDILMDQYFGESELSICRAAGKPGEFFTQATAIFFTDGRSVNCLYQINGNPLTNGYTCIYDVFGKADKSIITVDELNKAFGKNR